MWKINGLGVASWVAESATCRFDLRGGDKSIQMHVFSHSNDSLDPSDGAPTIRLSAVEDQILPAAAEQYVRQNRLCVNYPQSTGSYAIRLSVEPMFTDANRVIFELVVSIQTDLLDSHPMLDLIAEGQDLTQVHAESTEANWRADLLGEVSGVAPINSIETEAGGVAVLLDRHDAPTTTNLAAGNHLQLRLFGDFLEKGVIRTARPWVVVDHDANRDGAESLQSLFEQLEQRPLPLAT